MISRIVAWLCGALAMHLVLSLVVLRTVGHDHRAVELDRAMLADDAPLSVLVAGASHARNGVAAEEIGGLSMAVAGEHVVKTRYRLPWLLDRSERKIDAVILELDAATLGSWKTDDFEPDMIWGRYVPFMELGWRRGEPFDYAAKALRARVAPYVGAWDDLLFWRAGLRAFQDEDDIDRFKGQPPAWMRKSGVEAAKLHHEGQQPIDPMKVWALRTLIADLRARELRVVLVSFPVTREYRAEARKHGATVAKAKAEIADLLSPGEVEHLDHEADFVDQPAAFYDGDHLSGPGRIQLTRALRDELAALGVGVF